jgi:hypothetical protein
LSLLVGGLLLITETIISRTTHLSSYSTHHLAPNPCLRILFTDSYALSWQSNTKKKIGHQLLSEGGDAITYCLVNYYESSYCWHHSKIEQKEHFSSKNVALDERSWKSAPQTYWVLTVHVGYKKQQDTVLALEKLTCEHTDNHSSRQNVKRTRESDKLKHGWGPTL